jgi:transposase InsO family protein
MVSPARRRDAVAYLVRRRRLSERRACRLLDQHRSTQRYRPASAEEELRLVARMNTLAARHPRYGYRRIWALLRTEGWQLNRKRVERLWRLEGHRVPPRRAKDSGRRAQGFAENAPWNLAAGAPNDVWSYDFLATRTREGGFLRVLNVVDEYTRMALGCRVARSIGARDVIAELESLFARHGRPRVLRSDNGREFIAASLLAWLAEQGVHPAFIERGSPQQNPYVERFNGTMRDEVLRGEEFVSVLEAQVVLSAWLEEYNERRPHRGLGMLTPRQFAARWKEGTG